MFESVSVLFQQVWEYLMEMLVTFLAFFGLSNTSDVKSDVAVSDSNESSHLSSQSHSDE